MKNYAIIATIAAVLALGLAGFLGYRLNQVTKSSKAVEDDMNRAKDELQKTKSSIANIRNMTIALEAVTNSFQPTGDDKIGSFIAEKATEARQKIGDVPDAKDKEMLEKDWDTFHNSSRLNDFQRLILKFTENFTRSLDNIKPKD